MAEREGRCVSKRDGKCVISSSGCVVASNWPVICAAGSAENIVFTLIIATFHPEGAARVTKEGCGCCGGGDDPGGGDDSDNQRTFRLARLIFRWPE